MLNRVLSVLLALALALGAVLAVIEIALAQVGQPPWLVPHEQWTGWLTQRAFTDVLVRAVLVALVVVGVLLLVAALRRGRPGALALPSDSPGVRVRASRRGVERALATAARRPDGVRGAHVKARRRSVRVKASTALRSPGDLQDRVTAAVGEQLAELGLTAAVRPRVTVSQESPR